MNVVCFAQDWWDSVKNEMDKPTFNKKRTGDLFDELFSTLRHQNPEGQGMFHKKFIHVCSLLYACFLSFDKSVTRYKILCSFSN